MMSLDLTEGTKLNCTLSLIWAGSCFVSWMAEGFGNDGCFY